MDDPWRAYGHGVNLDALAPVKAAHIRQRIAATVGDLGQRKLCYVLRLGATMAHPTWPGEPLCEAPWQMGDDGSFYAACPHMVYFAQEPTHAPV